MNAATVNLEAPAADKFVPDENIAAIARPPVPSDSTAEIIAAEEIEGRRFYRRAMTRFFVG